jgi:hypothetical protein
VLIVKEPVNELLADVFEGQRNRLEAITDEVMEMQELSEVSFLICW